MASDSPLRQSEKHSFNDNEYDVTYSCMYSIHLCVYASVCICVSTCVCVSVCVRMYQYVCVHGSYVCIYMHVRISILGRRPRLTYTTEVATSAVGFTRHGMYKQVNLISHIRMDFFANLVTTDIQTYSS